MGGKVMRVLLGWRFLTLLAAIIVAVCVALVLPLLVLWMRPWWLRLVFGLLPLIIWGVVVLIANARAKKASNAIADEIAKPSPGQEEAQEIAARMREALAGLKRAAGDRRDYLYSRPWYVIIGPPGAGKTTALLNSGLRFPFSDTALKGVGGTRNLDFWFADEAALVDTAGRYTTQDSDSEADTAAWRAFLELLRKHRPLQPINGVMVAIGLDELLRADRAQIDAHAAAVRRRLAEIRKSLEISVPVYVLFTKADLLAGFVEFYDDLDVEGRRAVVGATLPAGAAPNAETLIGEYDLFAQSIADRAAKRLQEEPDARRRGLILGFPAQITALRARALRFLDGAFPGDREPAGRLRGFYLTSGVQSGTPLDRLLGSVAQIFDRPVSPTGQGRAYFLNRLLGEVMFAEAGMVEDDPKARARRRAQLTGGLAAVAAVSLLILVLWAVSFANNRRLQDHLLGGAQAVQGQVRDAGVDLVEVRAADPDLEQALPILDGLRKLPGGYADRHKGGRPLMSTFGLYQGGHAKEAERVYKEALQRILLPRILLRLEAYMAQHRAEPLAIYDALKTYLMLGGQGPFDAAEVKSWIKADWAQSSFAGADREAVRTALGTHLDALVEDGAPADVWPNRQPPLDGGLIAAARQTVEQMSLADRAYAILRQKAAGKGAPWTPGATLASGDGRAFANGAAVLKLSVPYFFTKEGYRSAYLPGLQTVEADLKRDAWVLGADVSTSAVQSQMRDVRSGVASSYARDYIAAWEGVIKALQPADYFHDPAAFGAFTRTPSPLKLLLLEVRKNTSFTPGFGAPAASFVSNLPGASAIGSLAGQANAGNIDAGALITTDFKPVADYVGDGKTPAPIDDFIGGVKNAGSANAGATIAGGGAGATALQGQLATAIGSLAAQSASAPPILQGFVSAAVQGGKSAQTSSAKGAVADAYRAGLLGACQAATQNHYPFEGAAAQDASVSDLLRLFGAGGQFDAFTTQQLGALLDRSGPVWRWTASDPVAATLDPLSAEAFHKASEIHDLLTAGLPLQVQAAGFGGAVTAVEISAGGSTWRFDAANNGAKPLMWTVSALPEAHVTLFNGAAVVASFAAQGPWALFRIMDKARQENSGPTAFKATFSQGAAFASLKFQLSADRDPFRRGSLWSFRCPASL